MSAHSIKSKKCFIEIDTTELSPSQVRLIKSINTMLTHVSTTDEENEFFDGSSDLMRMVSSLIKQANFSHFNSVDSEIPYADQAIEFSIDVVQDALERRKVVNWDN